jgi:hypothetical protein
MKEQLQISINNDKQCEMKNILFEAQEVFSATEKDFDELKKKTWYKRLFETVTFQKNNEKVIIKNISKLSELQNIILRIMLIEVNQIGEISSLVEQESKRIENLFDNEIVITNKMKILFEKIKFGYKPKQNISLLDDKYKYLLINSLNIISINENFSEMVDSRKFTRTIMNYCQYNSIDENFTPDSLQELEKQESETIYEVIQEYIYYTKNEFKISDKTKSIIENLSINRKSQVAVQKSIEALVKIAGKEAILDKYSNFEDTEDISCFNFDDIDYSIVNNEDVASETEQKIGLTNSKLDNFEITSILHVAADQKYIIENKIVSIKSFIDCDGNIEFHNCKIIYSKNLGNIRLGNNAIIQMENCEIICQDALNIEKQNDNNSLISGEGAIGIFKYCIFNFCLSFLKIEQANNVSEFSNCLFSNCFDFAIFEDSYDYKEKDLLINQCKIIYDAFDIDKLIFKDKEEIDKEFHSSISQKFMSGEDNSINNKIKDLYNKVGIKLFIPLFIQEYSLFVSNNCEVNKTYFEYSEELKSFYDLFLIGIDAMNRDSSSMFMSEGIMHMKGFVVDCTFNNCIAPLSLCGQTQIKHSQFINSSTCILLSRTTSFNKENITIDNCSFMKCNNAVLGDDDYINELNITNCIFENSFTVIHSIADKNTIEYCKFNKCNGVLIYTTDSTIIRSCEFYDSKNMAKKNKGIVCLYAGKRSEIERCIFSNCISENGYIIFCTPINQATMKEDIHTKIDIENCSFNNCIANNADKSLILTITTYKTFWREETKYFKAVSIFDCTGL